MKELRLTKGFRTIVDDDVYEEFKDKGLKIYKMARSTHVYAMLQESRRAPRFYLHRLIMNAQRYQQVIHINGNTLDNRRENLRLKIPLKD